MAVQDHSSENGWISWCRYKAPPPFRCFDGAVALCVFACVAHTYGDKPCAAASHPSSALRPSEEQEEIAGKEGSCWVLLWPRCILKVAFPCVLLPLQDAPPAGGDLRGDQEVDWLVVVGVMIF